ncbi:MAG TPA: hypothetical protein VLJ79_09545 [Candidatus Binatia bacterium]|nr:hypothetical protein [Candidatus Binatia bacterium]
MPTFGDPIMVDFPQIPRGYSQSKKELFFSVANFVAAISHACEEKKYSRITLARSQRKIKLLLGAVFLTDGTSIAVFKNGLGLIV